MDINLTLNEARVIGCLLEKESTTPDQYPLTLNALVNACNQKSNREPVLSLDEADVRAALDSLKRQRFVSEEGGSRVSKYRHRFCNTEFSDLQFTEQQRALVCCLLLRGPQTPGELRGRTGRMTSFADVKETDQVLQGMAEKEWVVQLGREAGKREARYAHLFSGEVEMPSASEVSADDKARIRELEHEVKVLKAEVERLTGLLSENN
ncbi:YceH family protein [Endozoicomonas arenosclerae]|uniref:YceH family protein n=1 Tax=Endozoicomonas arenosclerae TaxID=1633495 RepID=UPI0007865C62|nr:YceH family protein [Endozoicomonas arenosclerae]